MLQCDLLRPGTHGSHPGIPAVRLNSDLGCISRQEARQVHLHEGHPASSTRRCSVSNANGLRPSSDVIEATPPIAGDCHGILRRYSKVDAGDVLMVTRLDRLARSTRDLLNTLAAIIMRMQPWLDGVEAHVIHQQERRRIVAPSKASFPLGALYRSVE
jgi:hypothetical protein